MPKRHKYSNLNRGTYKPDAIVTDIFHLSEKQKAVEMLEEKPHKHVNPDYCVI